MLSTSLGSNGYICLRPLRVLVLLVVLFLAGCAHLGTRVQQTANPERDQELDAILQEASQNETALSRFWAAGAVTLRMDQGRQDRGNVYISFSRPDKLQVRARHPNSGMKVFELTANGGDWVFELTQDDIVYYSWQGQIVPPEGNPDIALLARMLRALATPPLDVADVISATDGVRTSEIQVVVRSEDGLYRLTLRGTPWCITEVTLLDDDRQPIAVVERSDYRKLAGIRYPAIMTAHIPGRDLLMTLEIERFQPESDRVTDALFDVQARLAELGKTVARDVAPPPGNEEYRD